MTELMPTLYKKTSTGATQIWRREIDGARYRSVSGQIDGAQVEAAWTVATPKNEGKANATTAEQQARLECESAYKIKLAQGGYHKSINDIDKAKFFKPMLAKNYDDRPIKDNEWGNVYSQPKLDGVRCCLGSTRLLTKRGLVMASRITTNDFVLASDGNFHQVEKIMTRNPYKDEKLVTVKTHGGIPVSFTEDHEFLTSDGWKQANSLTSSDYLFIPKPLLETGSSINDLTLDAGQGYTKTVNADADFWWFIGLFVGDGSAHTVGTKTKGRIALAVNRDDQHVIDKLKIFAKTIEVNVNVHSPDDIYMDNVYFTDLPLALWLNSNFRQVASDGTHYIGKKTAHSKTIPEWFDTLTSEQFNCFVQGWCDADGTLAADGTKSVVTVSPSLAGKMYRQFLARNILVSLREESTSWTDKGKKKTGKCYRITFLKTELNLKDSGDHYEARIKSVTTIPHKRYPLYDFQIEGVHDYVATTTVHNCIATSEGLFSRQGKPIDSCPHIVEALAPLFESDPDLILDGELYADKLSDNFNEIISLVRKQKPGADHFAKTAATIEYHIYDIPSVDLGFLGRLGALIEVASELDSPLRYVPTQAVKDQDHLDKLNGLYIEAGYEGQMVRRDGPYKNGRSFDLLKRKTFVDQEFTVISVDEGIGNRAGMAGFITYELGDGRTFKSGIKGNWEYATQLLKDADKYVGGEGTVRFFQFTPDGIPRFPVTVALYEGKRDL